LSSSHPSSSTLPYNGSKRQKPDSDVDDTVDDTTDNTTTTTTNTDADTDATEAKANATLDLSDDEADPPESPDPYSDEIDWASLDSSTNLLISNPAYARLHSLLGSDDSSYTLPSTPPLRLTSTTFLTPSQLSSLPALLHSKPPSIYHVLVDLSKHSNFINKITNATAKSGNHKTVNVAAKNLSFVAPYPEFQSFVALLLKDHPPPKTLTETMPDLDLPKAFLRLFPPTRESSYLTVDVVRRLRALRVAGGDKDDDAPAVLSIAHCILDYFVDCKLLTSPPSQKAPALLPSTVSIAPDLLPSYIANALPPYYTLTLPNLAALTSSILTNRAKIVRAINRSNFKEISMEETEQKLGAVAVKDAMGASLCRTRTVAGARSVICHV
jgi:hypothetical protein